MTTQTYTSANTSINSTKLPYIYNHINFNLLRKKNKSRIPVILDYGCGKYTAHIRDFVILKGCYWVGYDPFNGHECVKDVKDLFDMPINLIVCSNVLNTIKEPEIVSEIHNFFKEMRVKQGIPYLIKIYEGNGSCVGRETKKDCWQRCEPTGNYMHHDESIKKQIITYYTDREYII